MGACGWEGPPTPFEGDPSKSEVIQTSAPEGPYCKPDAAGKYAGPKTLIEKTGRRGNNYFAVGGGCLYRPLRELWAVTHGVRFAKWKDADLNSYEAAQDPRVNFFFRSKNEAGPFFARQSWLIEWYQTVTQGTVEAPEYLVIRYAKVSGTGHIGHWSGAIELKALTDQVTSVVFDNEIRGTQVDETKAAGGVSDLFNNLRTLKPDWRFLDPTR